MRISFKSRLLNALKSQYITLPVIFAFFVTAVVLSLFGVNKTTFVSSSAAEKPVIILDAGHGGEDGGAVSYDGATNEKDINLAVALKLKDFLTAGGFEVITVREDDISVCDEGLNTVKKRKTSDIKNRLKLINENSSAIFISIHQNHFTESKYSGTQIFYGRKNPASEVLASSIQQTFRQLLQPDNMREHKLSGREIYLLYNAENPSVMVECGFLSNAEECEKLKDNSYQNEVAFTIYAGLMKYIESCESGLT